MPDLILTSGAASDTGLLRERNEDRYWIDTGRGIFLVVDGVGGQAAGELAAQTAVEAVREALGEAVREGMTEAVRESMAEAGTDSLPAEARVREAIAAANNRIFALAREHPEFEGMACVLTLALVEDGCITIGHVGDSRLYLIWNGAIRKLTSDHSPVGEGEDSGELTEEEAMLHPRRNEVFRDVGSRPRTPLDKEFIEVRQCRFRPDAAILLCSDGLTDQIASAQVREIVEHYAGDPVQVATDLVEAANHAGGKDNITALFVAGPEFAGRARHTRPRFATTRIRMPARLLTGRVAFLIYGLLLGMVLWAVLRAIPRALPGNGG